VDRVGALLGSILVATATWALLGAQGARVGALAIPGLSPWWVVAASALVVLLTPRKSAGTRASTATAAVPGSLLLLSFLLLLVWRHQALYPKASLELVIRGTGTPRAARSLQIERRSDLRRLTGRRRDVELETSGLLEVPRTGDYRFDLACDDS
jgi:hypothetical protein